MTGSRARTVPLALAAAASAAALLWWRAPLATGWLGDAAWIAARFLGIWFLASVPATLLIALFFRARARANEDLTAESRREEFLGGAAVKIRP